MWVRRGPGRGHSAELGEQCERARAEVGRLSQALRDQTSSSPADHYLALGHLQLVLDGVQTSTRHLSSGLSGYRHAGCLRADEGPFEGDPGAAVAVALRALQDAEDAQLAAHRALERAHIATAHLALVDDDDDVPRRVWPRRRRARHSAGH